jgi:hypothetical protein
MEFGLVPSLGMGVASHCYAAYTFRTERADDDVSLVQGGGVQACQHSLRVVGRVFIKTGDEGEWISRQPICLSARKPALSDWLRVRISIWGIRFDLHGRIAASESCAVAASRTATAEPSPSLS